MANMMNIPEDSKLLVENPSLALGQELADQLPRLLAKPGQVNKRMNIRKDSKLLVENHSLALGQPLDGQLFHLLSRTDQDQRIGPCGTVGILQLS